MDNSPESSVRLDKWLWAVRIFKTRSDAADACRSNKVLVGGGYAKPSREVRVGDVVMVKRNLIQYSFRVLSLLSSRVGAALVAQHAENITPQSELDKLSVPRETIFIQRDPGAGRPTKRERREIDSLMDDFLFQEDPSQD